MIKAIPGYEGIYEIDTNGIVWSLKHPRTGGRKALKVLLNKKGYPQVRLYKDKKSHMFRTHRIVAQVFIPNPNNFPEVNHKNGKKIDNRVENLEWVTSSSNTQHSFNVLGRIGLRGNKNGCAKLTSAQVLDIWHKKHIKTRKELAKMYNVTGTCIYNIHKQLTWKWLTDEYK